MLSNEHPAAKAARIARELDADPVAAAQVQEHLKPERLLELLALPENHLIAATSLFPLKAEG